MVEYQAASRLFFLSTTEFIIPQVLAIATPKGSPLRYLSLLFMIWIFTLMLYPVEKPSHITSLFATTAWFNIIAALDLLLLNPKQAEDFLTTADDNGTNMIKNFVCGLRGALSLHINSRKINTPMEAKNTPPLPRYYTQGNGSKGLKSISRGRFLIRETAIAAWQYLILDITTSQAVRTALSTNEQQQQQQQQHNISSKTPESSQIQQWVDHTIVIIAAWFIIGRIVIGFTYRVVAIVSVGLRLSAPEGFPPLFNKMADAYTLRNFWGSMIRKENSGINFSESPSQL
ncbi:hypothetical protein AnigIFM60653_002506 [Aspergillus niger]|nr:hypothetical protein AnigIFM60653_002506 [Aspergillus niger]